MSIALEHPGTRTPAKDRTPDAAERSSAIEEAGRTEAPLTGATLVLLDDLPAGRAAIAAVARTFAHRPVLVARTYALPPDPALFAHPGAPLPVLDVEGAEERAREVALAEAADGVALAREAGLRAEPVVVRDDAGSTARTVARLARRVEAACVVVGVARSSWWRRRWRAALAGRIAAGAPCPVLLAPART